MVAQKLPEGFSADAFAAFMPQIFSRLDRYTGEMQLGQTSGLLITTEGGPCQLFRLGKVFFCALGTPDAALPAGLKLVADALAAQH